MAPMHYGKGYGSENRTSSGGGRVKTGLKGGPQATQPRETSGGGQGEGTSGGPPTWKDVSGGGQGEAAIAGKGEWGDHGDGTY